MDPHLLRTFVAVADARSFSAAARELGYTQSAVSQHIAALESRLGVPLLLRRPVEPTDAGARLLEHARPILLRIDAATTEITRLTSAPAAAVRAGASPLAAPLLAPALASARSVRPRLDLTVRVAPRTDVVTAIATGAVDLGLVDGVTAPNDPLRLPDLGAITTVGVAESAVAVALPRTHPLAGRSALRLLDLVDAWWLDAPEAAAPLEHVRGAAGVDGFRALVRYEGTDVATLLALVASGHGLALLPEDAAHAVADVVGVVGVPVAEPRVVHRVELVHGDISGTAAEGLAAELTS